MTAKATGRSSCEMTVKEAAKPVIYGYGDSLIGTLKLIDQNIFKIERFSGVSATELKNDVERKLENMLDKSRPENVLLVFGNVDLHINFIYQLQTNGDNAIGKDEFKNLIFREYTDFIERRIFRRMCTNAHQQEGRYIEHLLVSSVILPVVEDKYLENSIKHYIDKKRSQKKMSNTVNVSVTELLNKRNICDLESRQLMVSEFNRLLKDWCKNNQLLFIDINKYITEYPSRNIKQEFRDQDPTNIHILWEPTVKFWLQEIKNGGVTGVDETHIKVDPNESAQQYAKAKERRMKQETQNFS